jgi:hypothetical protein
MVEGRRPTSGYIPRFRNVRKQETDFLRGYAAGFGAARHNEHNIEGFGLILKQNMLNFKLGLWKVHSHMMGETIPKESNYVALDTKKDEWGIPLIKISVDYDYNDEKMIQDYFEQMGEMFNKAGFINVKIRDS